MEVTLTRVNDRVHLRGENDDGNSIDVDGSEAVGGEHSGFRPMQLVLAAIGSCTTMDIVPILEKQRQRLEDLTIRVSGERAAGTPSPFRTIHLHYMMTGDIEAKRAERAVELAVRKYCSVAEMLKHTVEITYSLEVSGQT